MPSARTGIFKNIRLRRLPGLGGWFFPALLGLINLGLDPSPARADPMAYAGKVIDAAGDGIPWALLQVDGGDPLWQSGADGSFSITGIAASVYYPEIEPALPFRAEQARTKAQVPVDRFLLTGRAARGRYVTSVLLWEKAAGKSGSGGGVFPPQSQPARRYDAAEPEVPPPPPMPAKTSAGHTLSVSMAGYQTGNFPQAGTMGNGLTLALARSATDTAAYAAEKKLCLDTINAFRAKVGLPPVAWSKSLEAFADQGARYDSERNVAHGHFSAFSKGAVPSDAENAVPGWPLKSYKTVSAVVAKGAEMMWAEGPGGGHYENIRGSQTLVGCGIYVTPAGAVWVLHDFK